MPLGARERGGRREGKWDGRGGWVGGKIAGDGGREGMDGDICYHTRVPFKLCSVLNSKANCSFMEYC